jgi:hypothetical protein
VSSAITITGDKEILRDLARIAAQVARPEDLHRVLGAQLKLDLEKHFLRRQRENPNKRGWKRQNFWRQVKDSVQQATTDADGASVRITHEAIRAKVFGAKIVAKNASAVTIPLHELAYGRRAKTFENEVGTKLFRITSKKGNNLLMADIGGETVPIYALAKSVTMQRDADALPDDDKLAGSLLNRGRRFLARQLAASS